MDPTQVRIYSRSDVPRLRYIAGLILGDILGLSWEIATDKRKLGRRPVINYSDDELPGSFRIPPAGILFESGINRPDISVSMWKELPVFFQSDGPSDIPFDLFAASFFLVTRYEEYLEHPPDQHGRYPASASVAFRNGFLGRPVVDLWVREFSVMLVKKFRNLVFRRNDYRPIVTFDINRPFGSHGHGILSSLGDIIRDLKRSPVIHDEGHHEHDRGDRENYEIISYISDMVARYKTECRFFFPVGDRTKFDLNPSWKNNEYRDIINGISGRFMAGLQPSYYSSSDSVKLRKEAGRLKSITGTDVRLTRFHSIRIRFPDSYTLLNDTGVTEDYSMGYPDQPGFRASIARSFNFYDVLRDLPTNLRLIPFQLVDLHVFNDTGPDLKSAKEIISGFINESKKIGGTFVSIWHNTSMHGNAEWKEWKELFEFTIKNQADDCLS